MRIDVSNWKEYAIEAVGMQEKCWLVYNNVLYLFKESHKRRNDGTEVLNDVSECIASEIACLLDLNCAKYFLCERNGVKGVITPSFLDNEPYKPKKEEFSSGVELIYKIDPDFKNKGLQNPRTGDLYTVSMVLKAVEQYGFINEALEMIVYDLLVGNHDRNPSNWGIIKNLETKTTRFSPLYDNSSSFAMTTGDKRINSEVIEVDGEPIVINDNHFKEVIHNHIISKIVLEKHFQRDGQKEWYKNRKQKNLPNKAYNFRIMQYKPIIEYLTTFYPNEINNIMDRIQININEKNIVDILDKYKSEVDVPRIEFAKSIVLERAKWMTDYYYKEKKVSEGGLLL